MDRRLGIVIQARVESTRLPGKALLRAGGRTLVEWVVRRAQQATVPTRVICALPDTPANDTLHQLCADLGTAVVRGSENDVLSRFLLACETHALTDAVRITGDCPLIDPGLIDRISAHHLACQADLTANRVDEPGAFPRGMDVEVARVDLLREVAREPIPAHHREHVTLHLYENPSKYAIHLIAPAAAECRPELRLCVDQAEDLELVRAIVDHFGDRSDFSLLEIIAFLDASPTVAHLNDRFKSYASGVSR